MLLAQQGQPVSRQQLSHQGLSLQIGPYVYRIVTRVRAVQRAVAQLYRNYPIAPDDWADFHVSMRPPLGLRRFVRPQCGFLLDGRLQFDFFPLGQAVPLLEWGMNWCASSLDTRHLILHAAVVARHDRALILPGDPGAGKSTLTAALVAAGWRLLSDELTLLLPGENQITPVPRPISLKNESIDLIRALPSEPEIGPASFGTHKGTIAHMIAPPESIEAAAQPATAVAIVFPSYTKGADAITASELADSEVAERLIRTAALNYAQMGDAGAATLARLIREAEAFQIQYSTLDQALDWLDQTVLPMTEMP